METAQDSTLMASQWADWEQYRIVPEGWYEWRPLLWGGILLATYATVVTLKRHLGWDDSLWLSSGSLVLYLVGSGYDVVSTIQALKLIPRFERRNLEFPTREANPLLPDHPTPKQFLLSWQMALTIFAGGPVSFLWPSAGLSWGLLRLVMGASNQRIARRLAVFLRVYDRGRALLENRERDTRTGIGEASLCP